MFTIPKWMVYGLVLTTIHGVYSPELPFPTGHMVITMKIQGHPQQTRVCPKTGCLKGNHDDLMMVGDLVVQIQFQTNLKTQVNFDREGRVMMVGDAS
jgi:hypothetical protein